MSANFMGGPRVALARIRDSRKQKLQRNALAQGATTAAAGASTRRADDGKGAEDDGLANSSKGKRQSSQLVGDTASPSNKRRKDEADAGELGRGNDTTANRPDFDEERGSRRGSAERAIIDGDDDRVEDEQQRPSRSTSADLDEKRRLLLDHDDWLGQGEIEGILKKKRKKGQPRREERKSTAGASAPCERHGQEGSDRRNVVRGERDVEGCSGEVRRPEDASEKQAHQAASPTRHDNQDLAKGSSAPYTTVSGSQRHQPALVSERPLPPQEALPPLRLNAEALYTNSIKGLFTSGALGKANDAKAPSVEARLPTRRSHLEEEGASKAVTNEAKAPLEQALQREDGKAEVEADGELGDLETMLFRQKEDTRRRLLGDA